MICLYMYNKRGQELSIGTTILIALGIILLVLLVLGFSIGWENLFSKIGIFQGSDLSAMVAACKVAVASDSKASFCDCRKVRIAGQNTPLNLNCGSSQIREADTELAAKATQYSCSACP